MTQTSDTIIAPASSNNAQAISVIRLSGSRSVEICRKFLKNKVNFEHKKACLTDIVCGDVLVDRAMFIYFEKPRSYTGENVVEIYCHGSPYIVSKIMELAINYGAKPARPGEFTMRAYLNGKLDLTQAEGICALINSQTQGMHKAAIDLTEGKISRKLNEIKTDLINILARIEAGLDDPDEEIPPLSTDELNKLLNPVCLTIKNLLQTFTLGKMINYGIKTAIVGAPNCGKSSLLNRLVEKNRVIVSHISGTTRDTVEETLCFHGNRFILIDTAGIRRHALNPIEKEGMLRTRKAIDRADIILFVTDIENAKSKSNIGLWNEISKKAEMQGKQILKIINKCDLVKRKIPLDAGVLHISCKTGEGIEKSKCKMSEMIATSSAGANELIITSARHYDGLKKAYDFLTQIKPAIKKNIPPEIAAEHIRMGLCELSDIIGETTPEDVLEALFENFCFGK